ncbi:epoxide hydrolase family protein [Mycoplana dimorpha]|uniref:Pimeloyl-ACP methyl ester carboxylesterase n=1 Tax=Mycoplana dimorpha TaxID=28320 RepID=A0A2T5B900_MYCDI|nr:epoxide hydrolase family protein [Mycoplana dimorpha]PTM95460.1 pimeloyl-ACP methyl ester carboxylesterase [Mycoplana dimorpha]
MTESKETVDQDRRRLLAAATAGVAAASASSLLPSRLSATPQGDGIRPFRFEASEDQLADLRRRVAATRWPDKEQVADETQGVRLATVQSLAQHWQTSHDWRAVEARLNAWPQFMTEIDGLDIHFIHVRSKHENALPMIVTHGWPGSIIEQMKIIGPLTDPTAHGGTEADAFHLVVPSLPGYGFSGKPTEVGWNPPRIAKAWAVLMQRLGYARYVAQGGDWGNAVTEHMALQQPPGLIGIHTNMPAAVPAEINKSLAAGTPPGGLSPDELDAWNQLDFFNKNGLGYAIEMNNRPQTLYALADSPVGLAAWMIDHDDRSEKMIARVFAGQTEGLSKDDILDNITLYWLTNTGISSARLYWDNAHHPTGGFFDVRGITIPVAVTAFPDEIYTAPQSWAEKAYPKLIHYNKAPKGGHFAAWEQPTFFVEEMRASFKSLRNPT